MKVYAVSIQWREKDLPWRQASLCPSIAHRWCRAGGLRILGLPSVSQWCTWHHQDRRAARNQPSHPEPQLNCEWSISCIWLYLESREKMGGDTHTPSLSVCSYQSKSCIWLHTFGLSPSSWRLHSLVNSSLEFHKANFQLLQKWKWNL